MKLSELSERQRLAAIATALNETVQNPRATQIRAELAAFDFSKLTTEEFRAVAGVHAAARSKRKPPPISAKEVMK